MAAASVLTQPAPAHSRQVGDPGAHRAAADSRPHAGAERGEGLGAGAGNYVVAVDDRGHAATDYAAADAWRRTDGDTRYAAAAQVWCSGVYVFVQLFIFMSYSYIVSRFKC